MKEFPLIISNRVLKVLSLIDHQIAKDLVELNGKKDVMVTQTFIDLDPKDSRSITFIQPNKVVSILNIDEEHVQDDTILNELKKLNVKHSVYQNFRSSTRIGRFVVKNFPDKYTNSVTGSQGEADIETFSNMFKATIDRDITFGLMDVVNGDDIAKWYRSSRYYEQNGSLGSSCMKSQPKSTFDVYVKNIENCSLVIMYADSNKRTIKGRALLWKLQAPQGRYFMDRIYTTNYSYQQVFIDFAKYNNWLYKSDQSIGTTISIYDPSIGGQPVKMDLMANGVKEKYSRYPYCDTMAFFSYGRGTVANSDKFGAQIHMQSTGGGYNEIRTIFSKYNNCSISKDSAKYCQIGDDYVSKDQAVRVYNWGPEGEKREKVYAVPNHPDIAKMELKVIHDGELKSVSKYFPKDKCTWSDFLKTWIFTDSSVMVWTSIDKKLQVLEYIKRLDYTFVEISGEYYLKDKSKKTTPKKGKKTIN